MNRTIKEAPVKCYHYDSHDQLRQHLGEFVTVYRFGRRLKTLKGFTPTKRSARHNKTSQIALVKPAPSKAGTKHLGRCRFHKG